MNIMRFSASWCQPCKNLEAKLSSLKLDIPVVDIGTEQGKALCAQYNVRNVPTIIIEYTPEEITKFTGANLSEAAIATIQDALNQ